MQVIQEADVAGFHATTLWSTDAHAINDWMNSHGYVSTPEVEKWAERYTAKGWYLTAFKVIDKSKSGASTGTVRMSFHAEKPYNPFYVPKTNIPINGGGILKVYFVSVGDYEARIGGEDTWQTPQWKAPIPDATAKKLAEEAEFPAANIPKGSEVETFVDNNFPRAAADDIYFNKVGADPEPEEATEDPTTPPVQVPPLFACFGLLSVACIRRKGS